METNNKAVTSTLASGGAGTFFEQHVSVFFLSLLTCRGIPPVLKDAQLLQVQFQTGLHGRKTDDIHLTAQTPQGLQRKLGIQVKRTFVVSQSDDESRKTILNFWNDYKNPEIFDPAADALALCVLRGTKSIVNTLAGLLDNARASANGQDFRHRLSIEGALSKTAKKQAADIKAIVDEHLGAPVDDDEFRSFLACLHVIQLDLNTSTSVTENQARSLLAACCPSSNAVECATKTWNELVSLLSNESTGIPVGKSYAYHDLPEDIRTRHSTLIPISLVDILRDHSRIVVNSINDKIGGVIAIDRADLTVKILASLHQNNIVVISGNAGAGKSAIAKSLYNDLSQNRYCFVFRAEEFAGAHIDDVFRKYDPGLSTTKLMGLLAGHGEIVFFIESSERLLEKSSRDAFKDFLRLTQDYPSMKVVLTCRDYSLDIMVNSIIFPCGVSCVVEMVDLLSEKQLQMVAQQNQNIKEAIKNDSLRRLLRLPYFLNLASSVNWTVLAGSSVISPMGFRQKCWSEVICNNAEQTDGIDLRRGKAFITLCVDRAKALKPYVAVSVAQDDRALLALAHDNLVAYSPDTNLLAAPSHDVLEDWAIIQWIEDLFCTSENRLKTISDEIGGRPALRRGFRRWLAERIEFRPAGIDEFVLAIITDGTLPGYFRDDSIVCMLQSDAAEDFIGRQINTLLANNAALLVKVIHMLRVGCKTTPEFLGRTRVFTSGLLKPEGKAWASVIQAVQQHLETLLPAQLDLVIGLITDWAKSVTYECPKPPGSEAAADIAYRLLPQLEDYGNREKLYEVLRVIISIPGANKENFIALIDRAINGDRHDRIGTELKEMVLAGLDSMAVCRDFPNEMIKLFNATYLFTEEDIKELRREMRFSSYTDIEDRFGIRKHGTNKHFYPVSAINGLFFQILRHHPMVGINFILGFVNRSCEWYAKNKSKSNESEGFFQVELKIPDESPVKQYSSQRLWHSYRGMSTGPESFEVALMALERWLLDYAKHHGDDIERILLYLLRNSNNVAITSVVSSIANAFPDKAGKAGAALLTVKDFFNFDRSRMVSEYSSIGLIGMFPDMDFKQKVFNDERRESAKLPHRKRHLETLALNIQLKGSAEVVHTIFDQHAADLPPIEEQTHEHKLWRLTLHRMDARKFKEMEPPHREPGDTNIYFGPGEIEEDVQEIIDEHKPIQEQYNHGATLANWGMKAWERDSTTDNSKWRWMLDQAKSSNTTEDYNDQVYRGAGFIACVCIRDYWNEMDESDKQWCVGFIKCCISMNADSEDDMITISRGSLFPDRAAVEIAFILTTYPDYNATEIHEYLAISLTHACHEVRYYAVAAAGNYLTGVDDNLLSLISNSYALKARLEDEELTKITRNNMYRTEQRMAVHKKVISIVRTVMLEKDATCLGEIDNLNMQTWPARDAAKFILQILGRAHQHPLTVPFLRKLSEYLVSEWSLERKSRDHRKDFEFLSACVHMISKASLKMKHEDALHICEPLVAATKDFPEQVADFLRDLILAVDQQETVGNFWTIWQKIADQVTSEMLNSSKEGRSRRLNEKLVKQLFLQLRWKEGIKHWTKLEGESHRIDELLQKVSKTDFSIDAYCEFLYTIGDKSLPAGFCLLSKVLGEEIQLSSNSIFCMEAVLGRYVYGNPVLLKKDPIVQNAIIMILDYLVQHGSSSAYKMRDDFVTPLST